MLRKKTRFPAPKFQLCVFKDDKTTFLKNKEIEFESLQDYSSGDVPPDTRISLYLREKGITWRNPKVKRCGFFFDLDHLDLSRKDEILDCIQSFPYKYHVIYTGGGFHVYVPTKEGIEKGTLKGYETSYIEKATELFPEDLHEHIDTAVFRSGWFTRLPGSINSKYDTKVEYISTNTKPILISINDYMAFEESEIFGEEPLPYNHAHDSESSMEILLRECAFVAECASSGWNDIPYEHLKLAFMILAYRGDADPVLEKLKQNRKGKIRPLIKKVNKGELTPPSCNTIEKTFSKCRDCKHNLVNNTPATISGSCVTPMALHGFHTWKKDKEGNFTIDRENYDIGAVVGEMVNTKHIVRIGNRPVWYWWTGEIYEEACPNTKDIHRYSTKLQKAIQNTPPKPINQKTNLKQLVDFMVQSTPPSLKKEDLDHPNIIATNSGILDLTTHELFPFSPQYKVTSKCNVNYDPEISPAWLEEILLNAVGSPENVKLLRTFMGLAISSIPTSDYYHLLWMAGISGSGKSSMIHLLRPLLGTKGSLSVSHIAKYWDRGAFKTDITSVKAVFLDEFKYIHNSVREIDEITGILNGWISGEEITVNVKYEPVFSTPFKGTVIVTSNNDPLIGDEEQGFKRRLRYLPFDRKMSPKDVCRLHPKPEEEKQRVRSAFFNFCLKGLEEAKERHKQTGLYLPDYTPDEDRFFKELESETADQKIVGGILNPDKFLRNTFIVEPELNRKKLSLDEIYSKYEARARHFGNETVSRAKFRNKVRQFCMATLPIGMNPVDYSDEVYTYPYLYVR